MSATSLTEDTPSGLVTVALAPETTFFRGHTATTVSDLAAGEIVSIVLKDSSSTRVASVVTIAEARIEGVVADVSSSAITVTDLSGFTRIIATSAKTQFAGAPDGQDASSTTSASPAPSAAPAAPWAPAVGMFVVAEGAVAADGTSLAATRVFPMPIGGPGHAGRPGRGDGSGAGAGQRPGGGHGPSGPAGSEPAPDSSAPPAPQGQSPAPAPTA